MNLDSIVCSDVNDYIKTIPDNFVNTVVTSPPYYNLRDYGVSGQIGLEETPRAYIDRLLNVFVSMRPKLRHDATLWINLGDTYRDKQLLLVHHRFAIAMQDEGFTLRNTIIWHKPAPMPESVKDRLTRSHEYIFFFAVNKDYYYDAESIKEPYLEETLKNDKQRKRFGTKEHRGFLAGPQNHFNSYKKRLQNLDVSTTLYKNKNDVWAVGFDRLKGEHFAPMPSKLAEPCILAGCPKGGVVFDPFMGSGTVALTARRLERHYIGCDLNPEYVALAQRRLQDSDPYQTKTVGNMKQRSLFE